MFKKVLTLLVVLMVVVPVHTVLLSASDTAVTVQGRVMYENGDVGAGATVVVMHGFHLVPALTTTADGSGNYAVEVPVYHRDPAGRPFTTIGQPYSVWAQKDNLVYPYRSQVYSFNMPKPPATVNVPTLVLKKKGRQ